ncbi:hypothetical protein GTW51_10250 [Aurantimonas aggregata]|uniref:Uncharacterized protein n=1 Tax=Aurantimonas aggregata TaxID=2047720 RepID=A0A6L9MHQ3_9HYPH|nr:hypothetical protein [Aurantimonas aggregata]NDV87082.1 hypothetical protein [Aurantimonas aggregata]
MIRLMSLMVAGIALLGTAASAQDEVAAGRYQMQPVDGGLARLDTQTGAIVFCRSEAGTVACDDTPRGPGRDQEMSRLDALESRVEALEASRRALVDRDDADYAVEQMKKLFSGFADIVRDLERDVSRPEPDDATPPDRT